VKSLALALLFLGAAAAQGPDTFEVASIKLGDPLANGTAMGFENGAGFKLENGTLRQIILYAYDLRDFQLTGVSGWMTSERYNILAKGVLDEGPSTYMGMTDKQREAAFALIRKRLQKLLAERFHLVIHNETRELPIYALVVAKGGVKIKPNTTPSTAGTSMTRGRAMYKATRASLDQIAESLAEITGRPVRNETGLTGFYDANVQWTPDAATGVPDAPDKPADAVIGPTLLTAVQEQLGLKLEAKKGPVEIVVVDRADRPTEN
jgi:bla regulator protein blaR1